MARTPSELHSPGTTPDAERVIAPFDGFCNTGIRKDQDSDVPGCLVNGSLHRYPQNLRPSGTRYIYQLSSHGD